MTHLAAADTKVRWTFALLLVAVACFGCQAEEPIFDQIAPSHTTPALEADTPQESDESDSAHKSLPELTDEQRAAISINVADRAKLDELIAAQRGKVVLVDFWATWCGSCMKQFPHTVGLSQQYSPKELTVISVSLDLPEDQEQALEFLRHSGATFDNLIMAPEIGDDAVEVFDLDEGIPFFKVYDRHGKLQLSVETADAVDPVIEKLVNES